MKKFLIYTVAAALVAFLIMLGFKWSFWAIFVLAEIGYFAVDLRQSHPHIAKWLAVIFLCSWVFILGGYWFSGVFPLTKGVLSRSIMRKDAQAALQINDGLGRASTVIVDNLVKEGDSLAAKVSTLMTNGSPQDVTNVLGEFKVRWTTIKTGLGVVTPPKPTPPEPPAKSQVVSYTVNKDEVISTLSVPDNSTVHIEADKAFCILERYGINDDGSEKTSKLNIPPGKSNKHFVWGGTLRVVGLYSNTTIKLHL